jgi:hypothetical protein
LPDGGREFIFPAARNIGPAIGLTLFWLVWTGIVVALFWNSKQVGAFFPLVFCAVDLLITVFAFNLWFLHRRVVVTPQQVTIQTSWLIIKKEHKLAAADITGISAPQGMTVGHSAYYDLKVRTGRDFTAASSIADKPEADWLVQQMSDAIRKAGTKDSNA